MSELEVVSLPNGQFAENCYLVADRRTREAVIIDPGEEPAMFLAELDTRAWRCAPSGSPMPTWTTSSASAPFAQATGAPIHLHPLDRPIYDALPQFGAWVGMQVEAPPPPDVALEAGHAGAGGPVRVRRALHAGPFARAA